MSNLPLVLILPIIIVLFILFANKSPRKRAHGFIEFEAKSDTYTDENGVVHNGFIEFEAKSDTYTDENGVVHKRMSLIGANGVKYDGYDDTPIFKEQSFRVERSIQIGQSDLYFCVNDKFDRFALGIPEYPTTMRFYDVSKIRKFQIVDDEAYISSGWGHVDTNQDGQTHGSSISGGSVYTLSPIIYIYMDDIHEPYIQLQFLRKKNAKSSTDRYNAIASARKVESVLELLMDKNKAGGIH